MKTTNEIMALADASATEMIHGHYHPFKEKREALRQAIEALAKDAWRVGTMTQDDFSPMIERIDEIVETVMAAISEPATEPSKFPENCGSGYCSCIECLKPVKPPSGERDALIAELRLHHAGYVNINARDLCIALASAADMLAADAQEIEELESDYTDQVLRAMKAEEALAQQVAVPQWVLKEAQDLALHMARKFYPEVTQLDILDDMAGVISQMSNMVTGLQRVTASQTPKMWSVPNPTNVTRDFSFYETKVYTVPYYAAAPQPPQKDSK